MAEDSGRRCQSYTHVTHQEGANFVKKVPTSDTDRMHGARVTLQIPRLRGWEDRARILDGRLEVMPIAQGQRIMWEGRKVWLTARSVIMYLPDQWFADTSSQAVERATRDVIAMIGRLERFLGVSSFKMRVGERLGYLFKFSTQHHGLVKNALAQMMNEKGERLRVYDEAGLWLLIDDSLKLDELEAVHPDSSPDDHRKVQDFFNSLKRVPITTDQIARIPERLEGVERQVKGFDESLGGYMQQQVATSNAIMYIGTAMKNQTELLGRLVERQDRMAVGGGVRGSGVDSEALGDKIDGISDALKVLVADKILDLPAPAKGSLAGFLEDKTVLVEILEDIPRFMEPHRGALRAVGPFHPGARIYLDAQVAGVLCKRGAAREILEDKADE